jgi:hypothetical protein
LIPGGILVGLGLLGFVPGIIAIPVYYFILNTYYINDAGKAGLKNYLLTSGIICTALGGSLLVIGLPFLIVGSILKYKYKNVSFYIDSGKDRTELGFDIKI